ncbi:prepilin peptidase [Bacillus atrophaeus]|uniref:prepilin peptidase n=1 Tax=Bacillus atrophaeus TaxID=1452 RepID=UPI002DB7CCE3|nr:prepilin peptidase [Bacillus atrophaeus]MEC2306998.1 prepilin peptidase [Bacillus atrophaeus]
MVFVMFILGLIFGSFFYAAGCRIPLQISIIKPRSSCSFCRNPLSYAELIPVFSFFLQKGRCKSCAQKLSLMYPAAELWTAGLFTAAYLRFGLSGELFVALLLISLLSIIVASDIHYMLIPDSVLMFFLPFLIAGRMIAPLPAWYDSLSGAAAGFFMLVLIAVLSKGGIGGGDIKLFAVLGIALGVKMLIAAFVLAVFIGMLYGACGTLSGKLDRKQPIPFAPAIAAGSLVSYLYGEEILSLYVKIAIY